MRHISWETIDGSAVLTSLFPFSLDKNHALVELKPSHLVRVGINRSCHS